MLEKNAKKLKKRFHRPYKNLENAREKHFPSLVKSIKTYKEKWFEKMRQFLKKWFEKTTHERKGKTPIRKKGLL